MTPHLPSVLPDVAEAEVSCCCASLGCFDVPILASQLDFSSVDNQFSALDTLLNIQVVSVSWLDLG